MQKKRKKALLVGNMQEKRGGFMGRYKNWIDSG